MADEVQVKQVPAQSALVVHTRVTIDTIAAAMGAAFGTLMGHVGAGGAQVIGPPGSLYPEPPQDDFAIAVFVPVAAGAAPGPGIEVEELPAVEAATLLHRGPYDAMEPSWQRLLSWVETSGRQAGGPMREVYLNDSDSCAPDELLTELVVPLA